MSSTAKDNLNGLILSVEPTMVRYVEVLPPQSGNNGFGVSGSGRKQTDDRSAASGLMGRTVSIQLFAVYDKTSPWSAYTMKYGAISKLRAGFSRWTFDHLLLTTCTGSDETAYKRVVNITVSNSNFLTVFIHNKFVIAHQSAIYEFSNKF